MVGYYFICYGIIIFIRIIILYLIDQLDFFFFDNIYLKRIKIKLKIYGWYFGHWRYSY